MTLVVGCSQHQDWRCEASLRLLAITDKKTLHVETERLTSDEPCGAREVRSLLASSTSRCQVSRGAAPTRSDPPNGTLGQVLGIVLAFVSPSDKPAAREDFSYQRQVDWLNAWLRQNDVQDAVLVAQDWGGLIGLRMLADNPERFSHVVVSNTGLPVPPSMTPARVNAVKDFLASSDTPDMAALMQALSGQHDLSRELAFAHWQKWAWDTEDIPVGMLLRASVRGRDLSDEEIAAYDAPFPDPSFKMGPRAMPRLVPTLPDDPAIAAQLEAWAVLSSWTKPFVCAFTHNDPITADGDKIFKARVPGAQDVEHETIQGGGHFVQEGRADAFARVVIRCVAS